MDDRRQSWYCAKAYAVKDNKELCHGKLARTAIKEYVTQLWLRSGKFHLCQYTLKVSAQVERTAYTVWHCVFPVRYHFLSYSRMLVQT